MFQSNIWNLLKLFWTALNLAFTCNQKEIVKLLLEQERIDVNAKDICLFSFKFLSIFKCFKISRGVY